MICVSLLLVLRYIKEKNNFDFRNDGSCEPASPLAYVDEYWAVDIDTKKSVARILVTIGGAAESYIGQQQEAWLFLVHNLSTSVCSLVLKK